jgi:hypothetical protein
VALVFNVRSRGASDSSIDVEVTQVILGGFSARSAEERDRHIEELRQLGIEPPAEIPAFWRVARHLLTTENAIEVQGDHTSGEAEYALIAHHGRTYVTVASDQTDRELERTSIPRSKQLCPKVLSATAIPLDEVRSRWDEITLTSDVSADGDDWLPYQRSRLAELLDPDTLVRASGHADGLPDGSILLSGTVPLVDGVTRYLPHFRASLTVPEGGPELGLNYRVDVLPEIRAGVDGLPS